MNTVFSFDKVAYIKKYYRDGYNTLHLKHKPVHPTVYGESTKDYKPEELEEARARKLIDKWTLVVFVQMSNSHSLRFEGERAKGIWREWCRRQFKKQKKGK